MGRTRTPRPPGPAGAFAERVESLRKAREWSASELAQKSGLGLGTVIRIESGTASPTLDSILAIAAALCVGVAELIQDAPPAIARARLKPGQRPGRTVQSVVAQRAERGGRYRCRDCREFIRSAEALKESRGRARCPKCGGCLDREPQNGGP